MFDRIATVLLRARWPILALLAVLTIFGGWRASQIRFDFSPRSLFLTADTEKRFLDEHRSRFGDEDGAVMVLVEAPDVFDRPVLEAVTELTVQLEDIEHIDRVLSLANMQEIGGSPGLIEISLLLDELPETDADERELRDRTIGNRLYRDRFINRTGTATAVMAILETGFDVELERRPVLAAIEDVLATMEMPAGVRTSMIGVPVVNREYAQLLQADMTRTILGSVVLLVLVLGLLFRSAISVLLPMTAVGVALTWTFAYMVTAGDSVNIVNNIVPTLLLVIGVGDAVHFLTTYFQELGAGADKETAIRRMVRRIGGACLLTSVTAAVGFASLTVARIDIIKGMGRVCAVGLMLSYIAVLLIMPTMLSLAKAPKAGVVADPKSGWVGRLLVWVSDITTHRPVAVVVVTAIVVALSIAGSMRVRSDNFLLEELFPSNPVSKALHRSESVLTGVMPVEIAIMADTEGGILEPDVLRGIAMLQEHMERDPFVGHSVSIADLVMEVSRIVEGERKIPDERRRAAQYLLYFEMGEDPTFLDSVIDVQRKNARVSATVRDWGTNNFYGWYDGSRECDPRAKCGPPMLELIDTAFGTVNGKKEGLEVRVTGSSVVAARALSRLVEDMLWSLSTAFIVISLLMMLLLRSLRIGLLAMIPNVLPLVVTLGFMGWVGIPIRTSTALIFSIALGVAVNDTIHFLTRYREELFRTKDRHEAVRLTLLSTGRAIIFTSVLLVFGFGVMMTTHFVAIFQMGVLGAVTLFAALLGDLLVLPVCVVVFRPWSRYVERGEPPPGMVPD